MADDSMALLDGVRKAIEEGDSDFLRETVHLLARGVMEAEVTELTGVPKGERAPDRRLTQRNGYLRIPRVFATLFHAISPPDSAGNPPPCSTGFRHPVRTSPAAA